MKKAMSLEKALTTEIKNVAEAQAIGNYLSLYEERIAFLEILRNEAEPGSELYEVAQVMIGASDMRLMGLIMVNPEERANNFMILSSYGEKSFIIRAMFIIGNITETVLSLRDCLLPITTIQKRRMI